MNFDSIIGQKDIITFLKQSIKNDTIGHAYLFFGPSGIGKKTIAKIFSSILLCEDESIEKSCGSCIVCKTLDNGTNPDFCVISSSGQSIGVEQIRDMQSNILVRPYYSKKKVYLICDAEKMTVQAQNCLLKTLEDPPHYTIIILTASNLGLILETIISRVFKLTFKKNTFDEVKNFLLSRNKNLAKEIDNEIDKKIDNEIDFLISISDGIIGKALELIDAQILPLREQIIDFLDKILDLKYIKLFEYYKLFEENKEHIDIIFDIMLFFYRDLLISKKSGGQILLINLDKRDIILRNINKYKIETLIKNITLIEDARKNLKSSISFEYFIEVLLMNLQGENING